MRRHQARVGDVITVDGSEPITVSRVVTFQNPKDASEEITEIEGSGRVFSVPAGSRVQVVNLG